MQETKETKQGGLVQFILDYETGELDKQAVVDGFQRLIDSGVVKDLESHYRITAEALIAEGLCRPREEQASADHCCRPGYEKPDGWTEAQLLSAIRVDERYGNAFDADTWTHYHSLGYVGKTINGMHIGIEEDGYAHT